MEYIVENRFLTVTVTTNGGQIKSVRRKKDGVEHIWQADPAVWGSHGPILFPYVGKIRDGKIEIRGQKIENAPMHGLVRTKEFRLLEQGSDHVTLFVESDEQTLAVFPYHFRLLSDYRLEGQTLSHRLTVENTDNEPFSFGIGYHPGFAIPFDEEHRIEDYELRFSGSETPICLDTPAGLLNGKYYKLGNNISTIPIREGLFDPGSHCMIGLSSETLGLYEKGSDRAVVCNIRGFPYCLIWSVEGRPPFVCIEPWHSLPGSLLDGYRWEERKAAAVVGSGERWETTMKTEFRG